MSLAPGQQGLVPGGPLALPHWDVLARYVEGAKEASQRVRCRNRLAAVMTVQVVPDAQKRTFGPAGGWGHLLFWPDWNVDLANRNCGLRAVKALGPGCILRAGPGFL